MKPFFLKCTFCNKREKVFCQNGDDIWTDSSSIPDFINKHKDCKVEMNVAGEKKKVNIYPEAVFVLEEA